VQATLDAGSIEAAFVESSYGQAANGTRFSAAVPVWLPAPCFSPTANTTCADLNELRAAGRPCRLQASSASFTGPTQILREAMELYLFPGGYAISLVRERRG